MVLADDFGAIDVLWICLAAFLVLVGLAGAYALWRLAGTARRLTSLLGGLETEVVPLVTKVSGTVDRVNSQLDKADVVTTSAVDAVVAVDKTVRRVTGAVAKPIQKLSAWTTGAKHGAAAFRVAGDVPSAYEAGRAAAARREQDVDVELARPPDEAPADTPRPAA
jgi:hypothetical protein